MAFYDELSFSSFNLGSYVSTFIWGIVFFFVFLVAIMFARNYFKYRVYSGEVFKRRQNDPITGQPQAQLIEGKAGYFKKKGRPIFRIKFGMMPWQIIDIMKLPDPGHMVGNKATFYQYNVGEILQAKKILDWNKGLFKIEPVDSTTKSAAKSELRDYTAIFSTQRLLRENAAIGIMGLILVSGIIAMYFVSKACSG